MAFRHDLFCEALAREAVRVYRADHLSSDERLVYCRMIELAREFVVRAMPSPVSRESRLPEELLDRLKDTLSEINDWQHRESMEYGRVAVDYAFQSLRSKEGVVVSFPGPL